MFRAITINHPSDIELLGGVPSIRGHGKVVPSLLGQKYALSWKVKTRNEALALMKEHPAFNTQFVKYQQRFPEAAKEGYLAFDWEQYTIIQSGGGIYLYPAPKVSTDPEQPMPIQLWKPNGYLSWIAERVDTIVDHWAGANTAVANVAEWLGAVTQRVRAGMLTFDQVHSVLRKDIDRHVLMGHYAKMFDVQKASPVWPAHTSLVVVDFYRSRLKPFELAMSKKHFSTEDVRLLDHFRYTSKPALSLAWLYNQTAKIQHVVNTKPT